MDNVLLESHGSTQVGFSTLIPKDNEFKLHLKGSQFIKRDKTEPNRTSYTYPSKAICIMVPVIVTT